MASVYMLPVLVGCFLLPLASCAPRAAQPTQTITIGGILSSHDLVDFLKDTVAEMNNKAWVINSNTTLIFQAVGIPMVANPIRSALHVCDKVMTHKVSVVIVSHPKDMADVAPISVSYTCGFYNIPVIGISARDSTFSDKKAHGSFLRTVSPYSHQADVWIKLLQYFNWTQQIVFIHSEDEEGLAVLIRFQAAIAQYGTKFEKIVKFIPGLKNYTREIESVSSVESRVFLLCAAKPDAEKIFEAAISLNMTREGYAWIVTEQALNAQNVPIGTLGLTLINSSNEQAHISDAVHLIVQAFIKLTRKTTIRAPPSQCHNSKRKWLSGGSVFRALKAESLEDGITGQVSFDKNGDRVNPVYEIINVRPHGPAVAGIYGSRKPIETPLYIKDSELIFADNSTEKPDGIHISTHLRVVTRIEQPFVYADPYIDDAQCNKASSRVPCYKVNATTGTVEKFCCYGYCMSMLVRLAETVNFTFELHLSKDGFYGTEERVNNSSLKRWNGMMGELIYGESDLIVAPLTINRLRSQYIDFSNPFKFHGLTILVKKSVKESNLASFLQPFQNTLWIMVGLSVHVLALVLYLLDRFSPFGRFKLAKTDETEEDALNLSSAMWFAWGVLFNSGIGEGTPRSFSARVLGIIWAGFAMIIVASYTANLAAFLVLDRPKADITGIDDARLRNPQEDFRYATVKNSAVEDHFKRQVELSTMYRTMKRRNKDTAEEAIAAVKRGGKTGLHAFIWDSSRLAYEAAKDCDLVTAGDKFARSSYGIGLKKGSRWSHQVSQAILTFHESGYMENLDRRWILIVSEKCYDSGNTPSTLGLTNMAGVFMMVAGGIVVGVLLIFIEISYRRHRGMKEKEMELARLAADRWRGNIEKRKILRETGTYLRSLKDDRSASADVPNDVMAKRRTLRETLHKQREEQTSLANATLRDVITPEEQCYPSESPPVRRRVSPPNTQPNDTKPSPNLQRVHPSDEPRYAPPTFEEVTQYDESPMGWRRVGAGETGTQSHHDHGNGLV